VGARNRPCPAPPLGPQRRAGASVENEAMSR
jgi:hypothetical protein